MGWAAGPGGARSAEAGSGGARRAGVWESSRLSVVERGRFRALPLDDGCDEIHALAWSPGGLLLATAYAADFGGDMVRLSVIPPDGGRRERLPRAVGRGEVNGGAVSPDRPEPAHAVTGPRPVA